MKYNIVLNTLGSLLFYLGLSMIFPLIYAIYYQEQVINAFILSIIITTLSGFLLRKFSSSEEPIGPKEGFAISTLGWIFAAGFGTLPFIFAGTFPSFIDAYFEAMSGFTTTGATVLTPIEGNPYAILFWRDFIQWLGGMGIIVLVVAILPALGAGGMQLFKSEVPGPEPDRLKPRIKETAKLLWGVYIIISALQVACLYFTGMSLFDALTNMFGTMPTGGFTPRNLSVGAYNNPIFETIIILFMFIAGANFTLHYKALHGNVKSLIKDREFLFYSGVILFSILAITTQLRLYIYNSIFTALRYASFQVVSIATTTGFVTADYDIWPAFSKSILLILMFVGGCAGSTGGAIKNIRVLLLLKQAYREIHKLIHPQAVTPIRLGDKTVSEEVMRNITGFFFLYVFIFVICTFIMSVLGLDIVSAMASVAATLGNVGPGLGLVGPAQTYALIPPLGKITLILCMLLGRLEIYTVLIMVVPEFWKK
ncbi:MAG: TrkH family potassium uptake protein [Candidatus Atribacteria bacterium]|nr:TrkH family potassium uptake protein [Candidatus Atribacteria bacterium]MCK4309171.1 TrkH family potassium uptake protein [Candidatus Atribacteria bacterium]